MCCFAGPVKSVSRTNIFARLNGDGDQFIAYQMNYESESQNAMILPVPAKDAHEDSIQFVDLHDYQRFFRDLERAFPAITPPPGLFSRSVTSSKVAGLKVHKVGNFVASFVPQAEDFARLDPQFSIPAETWAKIPVYRDYSFVVFQLEELAGSPHPMAFRFNTRHPKKLFFPTVHIHDGEVHDREDFDHTLYCQHGGFDGVVGKYTLKTDLSTSMVRSKGRAANYVDSGKADGLIADDLLIHRTTLKGRLENKDALVSAPGDPLKVTRRSFRVGWPVMSAIGFATLPIGWAIYRRAKLRAGSDKSKGTPPRV